MANKKHTAKEQLDFTQRLVAVHDKLPTNYISLTIEKIPGVNPNRVQNVRYNKTIDFEILEVFEEITNEQK
jgi:hypothetical protein